MTAWSWDQVAPRSPSAQEHRFLAFAPVGAGLVFLVLVATGRLWGAGLIAAAGIGISQARALSPRFARRFDADVGRVARTVAHGVAVGLSWVLLTLVFVVVFVPAALLALLFRHRPLGRPKGLAGGGWIPRTALGPSRSPRRSFGVEPGRPPGTRTPFLLRALAVVAAVVLLDLAAGAVLSATGVLPGERGEIGEDVRAAIETTMDSAAIRAEPWAQAFGEDMAAFELHDDAYLPFIVRGHHEFDGQYLNTTDRERLSYRSPAAERETPLRVAFFGGSVMFGVGQRDDHTIPSAFARVAEAQGVAVEVHNYGFPGWVSWQELLYLERLLAEGERFDVVVFFDGFNDFHVQATGFSEHPTHLGAGVLDGFASAFHDEQEVEPGILDGLSELASVYAENSAIARFAGRLAADDDPAMETATPERQAQAALDIYDRANTLIGDLADEHGSVAHFFWQPRRIGWPSAIIRQLPANVTDLAHVFDGREDDLYIDEVHTNEEGALLVAEAMWAELGPELQRLATAGRG